MATTKETAGTKSTRAKVQDTKVQDKSLTEGDSLVFGPCDDDEDDEIDTGRYRYSKGKKDVQLVAEGFVDFANKLSQAAAEGVSSYRRRHYESAGKKKDGAVKDLEANLVEGLSDGLDIAAKAPRKLARKVKVKRLTRLVTPRPFNLFGRS